MNYGIDCIENIGCLSFNNHKVNYSMNFNVNFSVVH